MEKRKNLANLTIAEAMWKRLENEKFANMQSFSMPGEGEDFDGGQNWWDSLGSVEGAEETETSKAFQGIHSNLTSEEKEAFEFFRFERFPGFIDKYDSISQEKEANAVLFSYEQGLAASMETARTNPYDPLVLEDEKNYILKSTILLGHDQGYTVEQMNELVDQNLSDFHVNQYHALLENNDPHAAKEYLDDHIDQVSSEHREPLNNLVDERVFIFDANDLADRIVDGPWEEHFQAIQAIEDEQLRETVRKMVHDKQIAKNEAKDAEQLKLSSATMDEMSKSSGKFSDNEIAAIPAEQWAKFKETTKKIVKNYADLKDNIVPDNIDSVSVGEIWNKIANGPEAFSKLDIRGFYVGKLSKEHQDEFREKQIKYENATPEEKKAMLAKDKMIAEGLAKLKLIGPDHYEIAGNYVKCINIRLNDAKREAGEELSPTKIREVFDELESDFFQKSFNHFEDIKFGKNPVDSPSNISQINSIFSEHNINDLNERKTLGNVVIDKYKNFKERNGRAPNEKEREIITKGVATDLVQVNPSFLDKLVIEGLLGGDIPEWINFNVLGKKGQEKTFVTITTIDESGNRGEIYFHMGELENQNKKTKSKIDKRIMEKGMSFTHENRALEFLRMKNPNIKYLAPSFEVKRKFNAEELGSQ